MAKSQPQHEAAGTKTAPRRKGRSIPAEIDCPKPPEIKTSAKDMADYLERYSDQLRRIAEQLRAKEKTDTINLPWPPCTVVLNCNGGGNGGGGGE